MTEEKKTDWSVADRLFKKDSGAQKPSSSSALSERVDLTPARSESATPAPAVQVEMPSADGARGVLARYKANKLKRSAALEALEKTYAGQLDVLEHRIIEATRVKKAETHVQAEEYLKELDAQNLEVLAEIGLRNRETRERALIELTERTSATIAEVQEKNWPQALIEDTIEQLFALRRRLIREIMEELGAQS